MSLPQPVRPVGQHHSGLLSTPSLKLSIQGQVPTVYISPKKEAICGLQRFKFTIKMRFSFFPALLPIISQWQAWHICQPHKAYKWVLHGDEILHFCHSKNVYLKGCAVLCKHLFDQHKFISLLLECEH